MWSMACTSLIILFVLHPIGSVRIIVKKCPVTATEWKARSESFTCKYPLVYHCIQDEDGKLMETCMVVYKITPFYEVGCPWASYDTERGSFLGIIYHMCAEIDCPHKNDPVYWSNQLYKYPRCLQPSNETTASLMSTISSQKVTVSTAGTDTKENEGTKVSIIVAVLSTAQVVIAVGFAIFIRKTYRSKRGLHAAGPGVEGNDIHTDPLNPG